MNLIADESRRFVDKIPDGVTSIENSVDGHGSGRYTIFVVNASPTRTPKDWATVMQPWPQSWSGTAADIPIGKNLVRLFLPFVEYLQDQNFTRKTLRRHVDNLWLIGGEIIRDISLDSALAQQPVASLLHSAIADGTAPLVRDASQSEQDAIDATARKLAKFLAATT